MACWPSFSIPAIQGNATGIIVRVSFLIAGDYLRFVERLNGFCIFLKHCRIRRANKEIVALFLLSFRAIDNGSAYLSSCWR